MKTLSQFCSSPIVRSCLLLIAILVISTTPAFADLETDMTTLKSKIQSICQPLAIIFLVLAGWQKAMGNNQLFIAALIGTVIMFGSTQIVDFISAAFGTGAAQ